MDSTLGEFWSQLWVMDPKALLKAQSRLRAVAIALDGMSNAKSHEEFSDHWFIFITAWKSIYTVLEQGVKGSAQLSQWFGGKKTERRRDPLLKYVYAARNDDEHGIDAATELAPGYVGIGVPRPGSSNDMSFDEIRVEEGKVSIKGAQSRDGKPIYVEVQGSRTILIPVSDRDKATIHAPPKTHLGQNLRDTEPITIARAAYSYAVSLLDDAKSRS